MDYEKKDAVVRQSPAAGKHEAAGQPQSPGLTGCRGYGLYPSQPIPPRFKVTTAMMNKRPWQILPVLLLAAVVILPAMPAGRAQDTPPQKIDVSKLKYLEQGDVVIPVPSEIFNALDKLGSNPNWASVVMPESKKHYTSPPEIAILLGTVIANGFVAVEAKDKDKVDKIGRHVIELAQALGVKDAVLSHCNSIIEAAKNDQWSVVRSELDKAQAGVRDAMEKLNSLDQARLVSIAGWLRGTQALTSLISADYKPERAELLHQPDILDTFEKQFGMMDPKVKTHKLVMDLQEGLKKIKPIIEKGGKEPLSQKGVEEINTITTNLVKSIAP